MSETCINCVETRLRTGCNCIDADPINAEDIEAYARRNHPDNMHDMFFNGLTEEQLAIMEDELTGDLLAEIDCHEFMGQADGFK